MAYGEDVWKTSGYISPREATAVPIISHRGARATTHELYEEKARMLAEVSSPPPGPMRWGRRPAGST